MIGIIVADENEINKFKWSVKEVKKLNQFKFTVFDNGVVFTHSGIGLVNSAAATQLLISHFDVKSIFNYGAVGGFGNLEIFDLIAPKHIYFHDVITPWYKRGKTPGGEEYFTNDLVLDKDNNLASGNSFLNDINIVKNISDELNVSIFDMEGAAIAQITSKNNIKLNMIKCVSDIIGIDQDNLENINKRIEKAGQIAFDKMISIIEKII